MLLHKAVAKTFGFSVHAVYAYQNPLTLNLPTTTIVAQPFNIIKWQLKFNPLA